MGLVSTTPPDIAIHVQKILGLATRLFEIAFGDIFAVRKLACFIRQ